MPQQLWIHFAFALSALGFTPSLLAQDVSSCQQTADPAQRLACYDRIFGVDATEATSTAETDIELKPTQNAIAADSLATVNSSRTDAAAAEGVEVATVLDKYWELTPDEKRDRFVFRTYLPSFFLPVHYTSNLNRQPSTPGKPDGPRNDNYKALESKLQISLRTKLATGLLLPGADLWFAFTQRSMWQLWNHTDSAPFRSTDYQPELIYVVPVAKRFGELGDGWRVRMLQFGVAHQSNGQSDPLSRSWNKIYGGLALDKGNFGLNWRYHQRIPESLEEDDNRDLIDYIGSHELTATWLPGAATAMLVWRNDLSNLSQGSFQLDMTYPVDEAKLDGLRWHLQLFSGYGETLLDYNIRQHSVGLGVMLFNF
ncbi:phospholipase [Rheinheimera riviphila]|uniref:Phospholipase A1 n=1 Tax=Rheinheimera riviphila TaxID=1834037 RepID=A0A437QBU8_9GAMM|nr:phospholipase A [Rheinheimera riviphila]RVU31987.1 phospholipase [Rheinheimera riviphila]